MLYGTVLKKINMILKNSISSATLNIPRSSDYIIFMTSNQLTIKLCFFIALCCKTNKNQYIIFHSKRSK